MKKKEKDIIKGAIAILSIVALLLVGGNYQPAQAETPLVGASINLSEDGFLQLVDRLQGIRVVEEALDSFEGFLGSSGTRFPNGISADSTSPSAGEVRGTTYTFTSSGTLTGDVTASGALTVSGETSVQGFTQGGGCTASTTLVSTELWTEADLLASNCFVYSGETLAEAISITLPASTTMTTLLPSAGDSRSWFYDPSGYAAATTTTFVAGTGIILMEPDDDSSHNVVIAGATSMATIDCMKRSDTDVYCLVTEFSDAD